MKNLGQINAFLGRIFPKWTFSFITSFCYFDWQQRCPNPSSNFTPDEKGSNQNVTSSTTCKRLQAVPYFARGCLTSLRQNCVWMVDLIWASDVETTRKGCQLSLRVRCKRTLSVMQLFAEKVQCKSKTIFVMCTLSLRYRNEAVNLKKWRN